MKNSLSEGKLKDSFTNPEKKAIEEGCAEGLQWMEGNQEADADAIDGKKKELEGKFNPIMMRVYQEAGVGPEAGMPGMPGGMPGKGGAADAGVDDLD
jgi:heat shock protein 1/8